MPELSIGQYSIVYNMLSFTVASMFGAFAFFVMAQSLIGAKHRASMVVSSIVVLVAFYHYFRIMGSWSDAYQLAGSYYQASGTPFNDAYRYVDWLITVPLLLVELVLVLDIGSEKAAPMLKKLVVAAVLMIVLGYPGEISNDAMTRHVWGFLSTIPFVYILVVLWGQLGDAVKGASQKVQILFGRLRVLILATWGFYPIAYMIGTFGGMDSAVGVVGVQIGYSLADVTAKALYGVVIFLIAYEQSKQDGSLPSKA